MKESTHAHKAISSLQNLRWMAAVMIAFVAGGAAFAQPGVVHQPTAEFCSITTDPIPSGSTDRPGDGFNNPFPEYNYMHSSTHLQGAPATEKHAPGLFWEPPGSLSDVRSLVVVNNLSPTVAAAVTVQFYDQQGTPLPSTSGIVPPEGSLKVSAFALSDPASLTPGLGSAMITSDEPIVGATLHHAYGLPGVICDPDPVTPGATSMQQLQKRQDNKTAVRFGPIPVSNQQSQDFLTGVLPLVWVRNPTNQVNNITITYTSDTGLVVGPVAVTLQPNGSVLDQTINLAAFAIYTSGNPFNAYYLVEAVSVSGLPLVGEVLLTDFFGPDADGLDDSDGPFMDFGARFRIGSAMMANTDRQILVSPEFTYQVGDPEVTTFVGIWNVSSVDVGPVTIRYYDRNGTVLATDSKASLPPGAPAVIGPGLASSPNYPAPGVFDGWVRVTACKKGLIGWSMRQLEGSDFQKVYGETLHGTNGQEPGNGTAVTVAGQNLVRKVKPVTQLFNELFFSWPAYENFVNDSVGNVGDYFYRFFDPSGTDLTDYNPQPFGGVRWAHTSFTYEDNLAIPLIGATIASSRVDHTAGVIKGIGAIGGPLFDWEFRDPYFVPDPTCTPANP